MGIPTACAAAGMDGAGGVCAGMVGSVPCRPGVGQCEVTGDGCCCGGGCCWCCCSWARSTAGGAVAEDEAAASTVDSAAAGAGASGAGAATPAAEEVRTSSTCFRSRATSATSASFFSSAPLMALSLAFTSSSAVARLAASLSVCLRNALSVDVGGGDGERGDARLSAERDVVDKGVPCVELARCSFLARDANE